MPIYEYRCGRCQREFEALVTAHRPPRCHGCGGADLERLISAFAVSSDGSRRRSLATARARSAAAERERVDDDLKHHHDH